MIEREQIKAIGQGVDQRHRIKTSAFLPFKYYLFKSPLPVSALRG